MIIIRLYFSKNSILRTAQIWDVFWDFFFFFILGMLLKRLLVLQKYKIVIYWYHLNFRLVFKLELKIDHIPKAINQILFSFKKNATLKRQWQTGYLTFVSDFILILSKYIISISLQSPLYRHRSEKSYLRKYLLKPFRKVWESRI